MTVFFEQVGEALALALLILFAIALYWRSSLMPRRTIRRLVRALRRTLKRRQPRRR